MEYDLIVVGGGSSGGAAAYVAAKEGLKTLLIEREKNLGIRVLRPLDLFLFSGMKIS